jgi:hypothetical protein
MMPEYYDKEQVTEEFVKERLIRLLNHALIKLAIIYLE